MTNKVILSEQAAAALADCYATRGKHKGQLKAKCPPSSTHAAAAWQGAMLVCNPYKASVASMLFMSAEQKAIRDEIILYFEDVVARRLQDRDRAVLERLGVW